MEDNLSFQELQPKILPKEQISVSPSLDVVGIPLEHNLEEWERYQALLKDEIKKADGVVFEYFPNEMSDWRQNPIVQQTYDLNAFLPFFEKLAEEVKQQKKDVYVLDPAHDNAYLWIRGLPYGFAGVGVASAGKSLLDTFRTSKISRRQALVDIGLGVLGLATLGSGVAVGPSSIAQEKRTNIPQTRFSETDFRRTVVAKGIVQMGEEARLGKAEDKKKILVIYPLVHWEGIKGLLKNRDGLDRKFQTYSMAKIAMPEGYRDSLFSIRTYKYIGNAWNRLLTRIK